MTAPSGPRAAVRPDSRGRPPRGVGSAAPDAPVPVAWSAGVTAALYVIYLFLTPAVSGESDGSEFTLVLATNGVAHPTGYPLYTLVGHWVVLLIHALGVTWPFAANAWCGLGAALAMGFFHALGARILPRRTGLSRRTRFLLALVPTLLLGLNPVWTDEATTAEVYSWHMAWVCGTCLHWLGLMRGLAGPPETAGKRLGWRMALWGALCGLGGAHHVTAIFFAGSLSLALIVMLVRAGAWRGWIPLVWLGAGLVPLSSYGIIFYRAFHPARVQWETLAPSLSSAFTHIRGGSYIHFVGGWHPLHMHELFLAWYVYPYMVPGLTALLVLALNRREPVERAVGLGLVAGALLQLLYNYNYGVHDPLPYFLPSFAVGLLAVAPLGGALAVRLRGRVVAGRVVAAGVATALCVAAGFWLDAARYREGLYDQMDALFHKTWMSIPGDRGIVIWLEDMSARLKEYQILRGEKTGLDVYDTVTLTNKYPRQVFERKYGFDPLQDVTPYAQRQPVHEEYYLPFDPPGIGHILAIMHETLTRQSGLPVYVFMPEKNQVRRFPMKPTVPDTPK